ncbi:bone morphogenetic protein 15 [Pogona vitticeps]
MARLPPLGPCGALLLLALLFPLETLPLGEGRGSPPASEGVLSGGGPSLPLIQVLRSQAPPRARASGRRRRQAGGGRPLRYMLDLYRSVADRHGQPRRNRRLATNTLRLIQPFAKTHQPGRGPWLVWTLDYRLELKPQVEHLVRAVAVYSRTQSSPRGHFWCTAEVLPDQNTAPLAPLGAPPLHAAQNATPASAQESWVEMDLSAHFQPWGPRAVQKSRLLRLSHACALIGQPREPPSDPGGGKEAGPEPSSDPFLLLYLNDTRRGLRAEMGGLGPAQGLSYEAPAQRSPPSLLRRIRQAGKLALDLPSYLHTNSVRQNECALRPFRVSFSQLGWDHWIIAPHWYRPQYCKGTCPRVLHFGYHSPNHAIVQNFINELVDPSVPRPSCVPYQYGPISVLMIEPNGNILYKVYDDMIAKSCTCR